MHRCKKMQGYSIIEVLVAFSILAMALSVLSRIFSTGLNNVGVESQYSLAVLVAESKLASPGVSEPLRPGRSEGSEAERFSWSRMVAEYSEPDQQLTNNIGLRPYRIIVDVKWSGKRGSRQVQLETIRLGVDGTSAGES